MYNMENHSIHLSFSRAAPLAAAGANDQIDLLQLALEAGVL